MTKIKEKLLIIDGNALIHRSFHALPPSIQNKNGEMLNAVYGFATALIKALKEFKPKFVVLTLDKKGPTFRHKQYKEYKANREKAPDELYKQFPRIKEIAEKMNIPIYEQSGFEADDLIGTIAKISPPEIEKIILTGDMDTLQLVNAHTKVYAMSRGLSDSIIYDIKTAEKKYDLKIEQLIDYKALRGDPSDNIPGVAGIGEKTAVKILHQFKTLDNLYKKIEAGVEKDLKPRIVKLLKENKDKAYLSRELGTIKCDVEMNFDIEKANFGNYNKKELFDLFNELEFKSLLNRIKELSGENKESPEDKFVRNRESFKYKLIESENDFKNFLNKLKEEKVFAFDTETTSLNPLQADLLGISFSWKEGEAYYLLVPSQKSRVKSQKENNNLFNYQDIDKEEVKNNNWLEQLKPILEDKNIKKIAHNIKYDYRVMTHNEVNMQGLFFDTMIASYLLNPGGRQHGLDNSTFIEFGWEKINKNDLLGTGKDKIEFSEVTDKKMNLYSCEDADFTMRLYTSFKNKLKEKKIEKLFFEIEMPLIKVLSKMENYGIELDDDFLKKLSLSAHKDIQKIEKQVWKIAGEEFNTNSTKQLKYILFEKLDISSKGISKTKTGYSTAASELEKLENEHEIIPLIQKYRELAKLLSTYIDALPRLINPSTKRIHTSFNQTVAATGRLSSTDPNLQNIPTRTELGREIRAAFVAPAKHYLISFDYSQIELRIAAHLSKDENMIKSFLNDADIHASTAALINKVEIKDVSKKMRDEAKAINFGILYGQGPHGLAKSTGLNYFEAQNFIDGYFNNFPGVKKYLENTLNEARKNEYVETMFARRRYLNDINSSVALIKKAAERMAINTPIQGTAADIIKKAMIEVDKLLEGNEDIKMLLQVHDELIFEVKDGTKQEIIDKIKNTMENIVKLRVPLTVSFSKGNNWKELK